MRNAIAIVLLALCSSSCGQQTVQDLWTKADKEIKAERKLELLSEAVELEPRNPTAYFKRGAHYADYVFQVHEMDAAGYNMEADLDDRYYAAALSDLTKAIELDPKFSEALWWRGTVHSYMAKKIEACADWKAAIALGYGGSIDQSICP